MFALKGKLLDHSKQYLFEVLKLDDDGIGHEDEHLTDEWLKRSSNEWIVWRNFHSEPVAFMLITEMFKEDIKWFFALGAHILSTYLNQQFGLWWKEGSAIASNGFI